MPVGKPAHGAECNRCGVCCTRSLCPLAAMVIGGLTATAIVLGEEELPEMDGPCPALLPKPDGTFGCGLVEEPRRWAPVQAAIYGVKALRDGAMHMIGSGRGCDCCLEGEPRDYAYSRRERAHTGLPRAKNRSVAAFKAWGVRWA